jgi:hypothetical protein
MNYTPIGIEVEEPLDAKLDAGEIQNALKGISATAQQLTQHILSKGLTDEQKIKFEKQMRTKAEFGKKIREMGKEGAKKDNDDAKK